MNLFDDVYFMKQALLEAREAASEGEGHGSMARLYPVKMVNQFMTLIEL